MRLSAEQVHFFERFAKSPEAAFLRKTLQELLDECHGRLRTLEGAAVHRAQGEAQFIDTLIANLSGKIVKALPAQRPVPESRPSRPDLW